MGIEYSKTQELRFRALFHKIAKDGGHPELPNTVMFSDADFAGDSLTLKSTSGSVLYYRETPILWQSKRQGIRATSTCQAEYQAVYDSIMLSRSQGFLDWYLDDRTCPLIFVDNQSAIALSKSSLVTKKSKHILLRYHTVRDHARDLCFVPTQHNRADGLTKQIPQPKLLEIYAPAGVYDLGTRKQSLALHTCLR